MPLLGLMLFPLRLELLMTLWLTTIKALLPHVGSIIAAASPHFTKTKGGDPALQSQIDELQRAAGQNAEHIKELAEQLRNAAAAVEQAGRASEAKLRAALLVAALAMLVAVIALALALN